MLNLRKLISLFLSIYLFGNKLPLGVVLGAGIVFGSAGVWAWDGQRRKQGRGTVDDRKEREGGKRVGQDKEGPNGKWKEG